jgi:hypothetical protein
LVVQGEDLLDHASSLGINHELPALAIRLTKIAIAIGRSAAYDVPLAGFLLPPAERALPDLFTFELSDNAAHAEEKAPGGRIFEFGGHELDTGRALNLGLQDKQMGQFTRETIDIVSQHYIDVSIANPAP